MHGTRKKRSKGTTDLVNACKNIRAYTEQLCDPLETEDYIPQPIVDVSPVKWNIAHTTWFFEEMVLKKQVADHVEFDPHFGFLFNSYYDSVGTRTLRHKRGDLSRPTVRDVFAYRKYVDERMTELLSREVAAEVLDLVVLGLNHEQQHQELLLTDLKYTFGVSPIFPVYRDDFAVEEQSESGDGRYVEIEGGLYEIGYDGDGFCFDNEQARHKVYLNDFMIADHLVTNAEYLEFIEADGYRNFSLWHSDGWDWVNENSVGAPLYWRESDDGWHQFTLAGLRKLAPDAPVCHISFYEAAAFAEWRGARLPTEFEWEFACEKLDWGKRWEWTNSAYLPYPGFIKAPGAVGEYNGKFMINQMVLRGASVVTPRGHSRPTYRNFFQPYLRWQFTGIR